MRALVPRAVLVATLIALGACTEDQGGGGAAAPEDHVWKEQKQALDKATAVGKTLQEAGMKEREAIDAGSQ